MKERDALIDIELERRPDSGRPDIVTLVFTWGEKQFIDRIRITNADRRAAVVRKVCAHWREIDSPDLRVELARRLAAC